MTILAEVKKLGQQIWLDNLSRSLIQEGTLAKMLEQGVCGVTSNPAIFQKAFANDILYTNQIAQLKSQGKNAMEIYETLAIADVQAACDVCRVEFDRSGGSSGLVSLEVSPELSNDCDATVAQALRLHAAINRPNVMIKIPATDAGLKALTILVAAGLNINLTLLFSRMQTLKAYGAYIAGLKQRLLQGKKVDYIQVVASFFISRIDVALDDILPEHLRGKTALALAKTAYQQWQQFFNGSEFQEFKTHNAQPVRLLWASTGVKNPHYADTLYVNELIGRDTVNTVPDATLQAFMHHGIAKAKLSENLDSAFTQLIEIENLNIDVEELAQRLQADGLKQFEQAFAKLLAPLS